MMAATGRCHEHCRPKRKAAGQDDAGAAPGMRFPETEQAVIAALRLSLLQAPATAIADVRARLLAGRPKTGKRANKAIPEEGELKVRSLRGPWAAGLGTQAAKDAGPAFVP
jgi:hypothetical protein